MESRDIRVETEIKCIPVVVVVVVVVCIFRYYIYIYKSQLKNKEGRSGTTWTGVSQKDLQRGERNK